MAVERKQTLGNDVMAKLQQESDKYKAANKQVAEAVSVLWNAQLDLAIATGAADQVERALGKPIGIWEDCGCNKVNCGGCGNPGRFSDVSNPSPVG